MILRLLICLICVSFANIAFGKEEEFVYIACPKSFPNNKKVKFITIDTLLDGVPTGIPDDKGDHVLYDNLDYKGRWYLECIYQSPDSKVIGDESLRQIIIPIPDQVTHCVDDGCYGTKEKSNDFVKEKIYATDKLDIGAKLQGFSLAKTIDEIIVIAKEKRVSFEVSKYEMQIKGDISLEIKFSPIDGLSEEINEIYDTKDCKDSAIRSAVYRFGELRNCLRNDKKVIYGKSVTLQVIPGNCSSGIAGKVSLLKGKRSDLCN